MNSPQATIILKSPDGAWTTVGTEASRGIVPEGIQASTNEAGPDTCSFSLRREASVPWPDLLAFNRADVVIGGTLVWGGRIWEAPLSDSDEDVIAVQGRGWQYHLDDDLLQRMYVHTRLSDWRDARSFANTNLSHFTASGVVTSGDGATMIGWAKGSTVPAFARVGITLDFGAGSSVKRVVVDYTGTANATTIFLYARNHGNESLAVSEAASDFEDAFGSHLGTLGASGVIAGTFTTTRRYMTLFLYFSNASDIVASADFFVHLRRVQVFSATAYESGNASVLKASQVVADVLGSGAVPLLDSSTAGIVTTTFSIPELAPSGYQTPRALIAAANAYEGNLFGVDAERKLFLRERSDYPDVEVGGWPGSSFQDASTNSAEGLYNQVIVQGAGPAGEPISVVRYSADVAQEGAFGDLGGVSNPGFETNLTGWTTTLGTSARVTGTDTGGNVFAAGSAGAQLTAGAGGACAMSISLTGLTAGAMHAVRFKYRMTSNTPRAYTLTCAGEVLGSGSVVLNRSEDAGQTVPFLQMQVSFVADATTATLRITADSAGQGGLASLIYIDDVHVYSVHATLLDRQGFVRSAVLSVDSAVTASGAQQLGDIWLTERTTPPLKGSVVVSGWGGARYISGGDVHPSEFLLRYGQKIRLGHLVDPSTGDQGRDGNIVSVSYAHDTETATLELDSERGRLTTLLSRLAVVTSQVR